jgi:lipid kinase YegS
MLPSHRRWLYVLLNARAAADAAVRDAVADLRQRGHKVEVRALWESGEAAACAGEAAARGCEVIVSAGGDGTLNEVVNGVMSRGGESAVAAMAHGTANDFARATGLLDLTPLEALALAAQGTATPIDVGRCNERYFLNVASGGFGAKVTATTPAALKSFLGGLAYTLTGLFELLTEEERQARLRHPGGEWEGPLLLFTVANARLAGGGYVVGPNALLDDGLLDLQVVSSFGVAGVTEYVGQLFVERTLDASHGPAHVVPWLEIASHGELHVNLDGEPMTPTASYRFEALPRRLRFVLPEAGKALLTAKGPEKGA